MARSSFKTYQSLLGVTGEPVQWRDGYALSATPFEDGPHSEPGEPDYPHPNARVADLRPKGATPQPDEHPFRAAPVRRFTQMVFNIAIYQRLLMEDFLRSRRRDRPPRVQPCT
ncbi:MAG: hypothetical protein JO006_01755 [Paucibacter sp.]|nr:hypothetical protein [Roseateles sp.]